MVECAIMYWKTAPPPSITRRVRARIFYFQGHRPRRELKQRRGKKWAERGLLRWAEAGRRRA